MSKVKPKVKHAPGPWHYSKTDYVLLAQGYRFALPFEVSDAASAVAAICLYGEYTEAHARLIAAAPDLLAAAKNSLAYCRDLGPCSDAALAPDEYCSDSCVALMRAIAKAEGHA